jgi:hypothetical protein
MDEPGSEVGSSSEDRTYAEDRKRRLHRGRVLGFSVCIALWLLSAVPLAHLSSNQGGGVGITAAYLAAGLALAIVTRGIYAWRRGRPFWSPWLFLVAAGLAIVSYAVQSAGDKATAGSRIERTQAVADTISRPSWRTAPTGARPLPTCSSERSRPTEE